MELTEEQKLVTGIADYFNIEVPDIISEYVTDSVTVQRMIYAIVTVRNTERLKRLYNANKIHFMMLYRITIQKHTWKMTNWLHR